MRFVIISLLALLSMSAIVLIKNPLVKTNWKIIHAIKENGSKEDFQKDNYIINFQEKYFSVFFDENECTAQYQLQAQNRFSVFVGGSCTKICCDKPKAEWLKKRIYESRKIYIKNDTIKIWGDNFKIVAIKNNTKK